MHAYWPCVHVIYGVLTPVFLGSKRLIVAFLQNSSYFIVLGQAERKACLDKAAFVSRVIGKLRRAELQIWQSGQTSAELQIALGDLPCDLFGPGSGVSFGCTHASSGSIRHLLDAKHELSTFHQTTRGKSYRASVQDSVHP